MAGSLFRNNKLFLSFTRAFIKLFGNNDVSFALSIEEWVDHGFLIMWIYMILKQNLLKQVWGRGVEIILPYIHTTSDMQCNCMMGVFPPISRAWLTIDSDIFMWNYEDGYVFMVGLL